MGIRTDLHTEIELEHWDLISQPQRRLLELRLGKLWRYRALVLVFVRCDFVSVFKQTILGQFR